jgi:hypothetical protein
LLSLGRAAIFVHLLVVGLMLGQDFLSHLLLSFVDIRVELVPIFFDRELLVIVNGNENLLCANWLLVGVVELRNVWVLECLLNCQSLVWVELE